MVEESRPQERSKLQSSEVRLKKTDLPAEQRRKIQDAIRILYQRHVVDGKLHSEASEAAEAASAAKRGSNRKPKERRREDKWAEFAAAMKTCLDKAFQPHWHVFVGTELGFACKKRNKTMGLWIVGAENCNVIVYQSPGIEITLERPPLPPLPPREGEAGAAEDEADEASEDTGAGAEQAPRVAAPQLRLREPSEAPEGSEAARAVAALRDEASRCADAMGPQAIATQLRTRLTEELGTIWHVVLGSECAISPAADRRNFIDGTLGARRLVCFQHEQFTGTTIDWQVVLNSLPYLLLVIFCFAVLTIHSICKDPGATAAAALQGGHETEEVIAAAAAAVKGHQTWLEYAMCSEESESRVYTLGSIGVAVMFAFKGKRFMHDFKANRAK